MKQSLSKLVDVIRQKLSENSEGSTSENGLRSWLLREGYAKRDIDAAFRMVSGGTGVQKEVNRGPGQVRQLSDYEFYRLSADARAALARLDLYELISPGEREVILDRLDQFEGEVTLTDLDYLINWLVMPSRDAEHQRTIFNVLTGKEDTVH